MKIVYYFYSAFSGSFIGMLLDEAIKASKERNAQVFFVLCDGFLDMCLSNPEGNKAVCSVCRYAGSIALKSQFTKVGKVLHLKDYYNTNDERIDLDNIKFRNIDEYKKIEYKGIKIGYASLSTYVQLTRNQNPRVDIESAEYFKALLNQSVRLSQAFQGLIDQVKPDLICTYNGRFAEIRPVFEMAKLNKIPVWLYEGVFKGGKEHKDGKLYKVVFENTLPHSVKDNLWRVEKCWNNPELSKGENIAQAHSFFKKRRKGIVAGDKIYVKNQETGLLPAGWNSSKKNIVIFNSSEDEFVAIGDEYAAFALFKTQNEGLSKIFEWFKMDRTKHFYLRIHPNLTGIRYKYHTELYKFQTQYENVTIIPPEDKISTYALLDASDKVIVFGSTIGLEAVYWKKPVILIAFSFYYYANLCHIPKNELQLYEMIREDLPLKYSEEVLKFGLYYLNKDPLLIDNKAQFRYLDYNNTKYRIFGKAFHGYNYLKILNSKILYAGTIAIGRQIASSIFPNRFKLPLEDE